MLGLLNLIADCLPTATIDLSKFTDEDFRQITDFSPPGPFHASAVMVAHRIGVWNNEGNSKSVVPYMRLLNNEEFACRNYNLPEHAREFLETHRHNPDYLRARYPVKVSLFTLHN